VTEIRLEERENAALVTIDRPQKLNALTMPMLSDLGRVLREQGRSGRTIVVTGSARAFSAGDDLPATEDLDESSFGALLQAFQELTRAVLASRGPVVAAINGIAVGGAAEFALSCDVRVGCPATEFLFPENRLGLTISNGSSYLLSRLTRGRALEIVLSGRRIGAEEAFTLGLLDRLSESVDSLVPDVVEMADKWSVDSASTEYHLRLLRPPVEEVERAMKREVDIGAEAWRAGIPQRGIAAFLESRKSGA
jgi:enoyl-CoA hydratase